MEAGYFSKLRRRYTDCLIKGRGVEVGAGIDPVRNANAEHTWHVDKRSAHELEIKFGDFLSYPVSTWEEVSAAEPDGLDFVVSHHVLEHCHDPIGTLAEWVGYLKPGGVLCFSIPAPSNPTEAGRPQTPLRHLIEDHFFSRPANGYDSMAHLPTFVMALASAEEAMRPWYTRHGAPEMSRFVLKLLDQPTPDIHWHTPTLETAQVMGEIAFFLAGASGKPLLAQEGEDFSLYLAWSKGKGQLVPSPLAEFQREIEALASRLSASVAAVRDSACTATMPSTDEGRLRGRPLQAEPTVEFG